jgi:hypothetical protein
VPLFGTPKARLWNEGEFPAPPALNLPGNRVILGALELRNHDAFRGECMLSVSNS